MVTVARLWKFDTPDAARQMVRVLGWTTVILAIANGGPGLIELYYGTLGVPVWELLANIVIVSALAALIFRYSRIAAILSALLIVLDVLLLRVVFPALGELDQILFVFIVPLLIGGVRATFAWHRFAREPESAVVSAVQG